MCADFAEDKVRVLGGVDLSRKGSVDAAILPLVGYLNRLDCYYSTSSCSGRLVLFEEVGPCTHAQIEPRPFSLRVRVEARRAPSLTVGRRAEKERLLLAAGIT